jgi:hypothetical protein
MTDSGMEAPVDDAIEQRQSAGGSDDETEPGESDGARWPTEVPLDVDEADAAEQGRTVELDEDDYR